METTLKEKKKKQYKHEKKEKVQFKPIKTNSPLNIGVYKLQFFIPPKPVGMKSVDVDA